MQKTRFNEMHLEQLMRVMGYTFKNRALLESALTHRSAGRLHNERLEFLGDAILSGVIAEQLYYRFEKATEGQLSRMRALLVKEPTLAAIARTFEISPLLQLGIGEKKSGGFTRDSILSDALEAIIGAIYLDGGLEPVKACLLHWYETSLNALVPDACHKDPKTKLQEWLQARHLLLPVYTLVEMKHHPVHPTFKVCVSLEALGLSASAEGASRRQAEQAAACLLLEKLPHV